MLGADEIRISRENFRARWRRIWGCFFELCVWCLVIGLFEICFVFV